VGSFVLNAKFKAALKHSYLRSIGSELVQCAINEVLIQGAAPLFFVPQLPVSLLDAPIVNQILNDISKGCVDSK
jgi:phosphoribosylaminoimidazole (AIR) synthetase